LTDTNAKDLRGTLESLALEACLTIEEFTLQGIVLATILSSTETDYEEIRNTVLQSQEPGSFNEPALDQFISLNMDMLESESLNLQLLVSEDESTHTKLEELSAWVTSFLNHLESGESNDEALEIIEDLEAIANVDTQIGANLSSANREAQDQMTEECIEHVRISVMLLHELM